MVEKESARVQGVKTGLRTTKISSRPTRPKSKKRTNPEWPIYCVAVVSLYVLTHATFVSSLGSWHVIVAMLAITFCALPLLLRYVGKMRKIAAQKAKPTVGNWLLNFGLLIIFLSPSVLLVVGGEGWWTLQDMLPYRSDTLLRIFDHFADLQPRPTVTPAQQAAFEDYLNGN